MVTDCHFKTVTLSSSLCVLKNTSVHVLLLPPAPPACMRKGGRPLLLDNHVSLEESLAERLCTAAGCGLLVPPYFPLRLLHHYHHHHSNLAPPPPPSLAHTALWLPSLGNCLRILPACSVIGRWHSGVPLPDPASCADYCLLMFQRSSHPSIPPHTHLLLAPVARQHL